MSCAQEVYVWRTFTIVTMMSNFQRRTKRQVYVHACTGNKNHVPKLILAHLNIADFPTQKKTSHMRNRIRTQEHTPVTSRLVFVWLHGPPSAVGPLSLNSEACGEGGRWGGQMGTQYTFTAKHKSSWARGWTLGGGVAGKRPSSTCHSWGKEKSGLIY